MLFLLCLFLHNVFLVSGCNDTVLLPELERRARNYRSDGLVDPYVSDYVLSNRWYSVYQREQQYLMPDSNTMPDHFACGGYEPIYIDGTHPDPDSLSEIPTDAVACLRSTFDDCDYQYNIKVRKCEDEIQYYLVSTKLNSAYCIDPPELQNGDGNFSPAPTEVELGEVKVAPRLLYDEENKPLVINGQIFETINYSPFIVFRCEFAKQNYFYAVNWYINGNLFRVLGPTQTTDDLDLSESTFIDNNIPPGITLRCGVRVSNDVTGHATVMVSSPDYFAGIQILNQRIDLPKDDQQAVQFKLTIPLGCRYNSHTEHPSCDIGLSMFDPVGYRCNEANLATVSGSQKCGQDLTGLQKGDTWDPERVYYFNVSTTDETYDDKKDFVLQLRVDRQAGHKWWREYQPDNIKVIVNEIQYYKDKVCHSHVDPHMKTADGYYYENQEKGEYLLYRNTKFDIEVLEKTNRCNGNRALCTCGIIVRAGADVFAINLCNTVRFIEFLSCEEGGILKIVKKNERRYEIFTPIGTWVQVNIHSIHGTYDGFMNVDIMMAPKDVKRTEGLCGYMDGFRQNDLRGRNGVVSTPTNLPLFQRHHKDFSNSWKLTDEENLFKKFKKEFKRWEETNALYCVCEQALTDVEGTTGRIAKALCSPSQYLDCYRTQGSITVTKCKKLTRGKRSVQLKKTRELERLLALAYQPDDYRVEREIVEQNISESEALESCSNVINGSTIVEDLPDALPGENTNAVIEQCVFDVMVGNDLSLADVHVDALNSVAQMKFNRDPVFVANNTDKVITVIKNSCPSNCTQRGTCSDEGECICFTFYHGPDCSIDERETVIIDDMEGGGLCNLTDGDSCECFYFRTHYLLPNFTCAVSGVVRYIDDTEENITSPENQGEYEDIFTGLCCVPDKIQKRSTSKKIVFSTRYDIAVSNDGNNFGPAEPIHVFNSDCQEALLDTNNQYHIVMKNGYCYIDGLCIEQNQLRISDDCFTCEPNVNVYNWTRSCQQREVKDDNTAVLLGAVIGSVSVCVVVGLFSLWYFKVKQQHKKQMSVGDRKTFSGTAVEVTVPNPN